MKKKSKVKSKRVKKVTCSCCYEDTESTRTDFDGKPVCAWCYFKPGNPGGS